MRSRLQIGLLLAVAAFALAGGIYLRLSTAHLPSQDEVRAAVERMRLTDLSGQPTSLDAWRGKVLVVNFWASWCAPCREEIPGFVGVQNKYVANGLQIVGIAVDSVEQARAGAVTMGVTYPVLVGGPDSIDVSRKLGNRAGGLPYTLVFNRRGKVVLTQVGMLSAARLEDAIRPLLDQRT